MGRDPITYDANLYRYAANLPLTARDPSGLTITVLEPETTGVVEFDTWMKRSLLLGQQHGQYWWKDRGPLTARTYSSWTVPRCVCDTCKMFAASCTVYREAFGFSQIFYNKVVRGDLPVQFAGLVRELNAQVEWEENAHQTALLFWISDYHVTGLGVGCTDSAAKSHACETARKLETLIELARVTALKAHNALIDKVGLGQRRSISRRAVEIARRLAKELPK